jgi:hypothetical protein
MEPVIITNEPELIPQDKMDKLVELSNRASELEADLERLDEELSQKSKELQTVLGGYQQPGLLVVLLQELGISSITLADGNRIVIDEELKPPSMAATSKYREVVIEWLKKDGHGGVIKNELTVNIPKGQDALADIVEKSAVEQGLQVKRFETVNAQTLGALLRELLEAGADVPLEQIGAFMFRKAEVLKVKEKK